MVLPVLSYGHSLLRKKCSDMEPGFPGLGQTIADMWDTLYGARGCGLAAPQVNLPVRLFLVDSKESFENMDEEERKEYFEGDEGIREVFINAQITERSEDTWVEDEGCLSVPGLDEPVERPWSITIEYSDAEFNRFTRKFSGITARMIQHEYDHTEGILYLDHLKPFTRELLKSRLAKISKGQIKARYPMKFPR